MPYFLGIDTSNYTTSAALYNSHNKDIIQSRKILPVKEGEIGLRQSDAVFHHTKQLPQVIQSIFDNNNINSNEIEAIGVSVCPRDIEGSYMPCFMVGKGIAEILSSILKVPLYNFSHQAGHIMAALYSAKKLDLINEQFIAFHLSGGTTEALMVYPSKECIFKTDIIAKTLDATAGQIIDRTGVMLGLKFPAGSDLEKLAINYFSKNSCMKVNTAMKGTNCCLSGVENICRKLYNNGATAEEIAAKCFSHIYKAIESMCTAIIKEYGERPLLFSGGVMSSTFLKENLSKKFNAYFAEKQFSSDNACGTAILAALKAGELW